MSTHGHRPSPCGNNEFSVPDKIGEFLLAINTQCAHKGFLPTYLSFRGRPDMLPLAPDNHAAVPLLNHLGVNSAPVTTASDMPPEDRRRAVMYGCHASA